MVGIGREAIEAGVEQRGQDLAHAVGAEVEAEQPVAVSHAGVVADRGGGDELVEPALGMRGGDGVLRAGEAGAGGLHHHVVGGLDAFPPRVAVHREVAAADRRDAAPGGQRGLEAGEVVGRGLRRGVASVGPGMHQDLDPRGGGGAGERDRVVLVAVHAARREQPHQVQPPARGLQLAEQRRQGRHAGNRAVLTRRVDPDQILHHHPPGADVEVPHLRIAHLPLGQPHVTARGAQESPRALGQSASKQGVRAWRTALSASFSRQPQPSRITSITGRGGWSGMVVSASLRRFRAA
jgi:hypothetical protein